MINFADYKSACRILAVSANRRQESNMIEDLSRRAPQPEETTGESLDASGGINTEGLEQTSRPSPDEAIRETIGNTWQEICVLFSDSLDTLSAVQSYLSLSETPKLPASLGARLKAEASASELASFVREEILEREPEIAEIRLPNFKLGTIFQEISRQWEQKEKVLFEALLLSMRTAGGITEQDMAWFCEQLYSMTDNLDNEILLIVDALMRDAARSGIHLKVEGIQSITPPVDVLVRTVTRDF